MREKDLYYGIAENVMFGQMALMGTGVFDAAFDIDMLKDVIVDFGLPTQSTLSAHVGDGITAGQGAMTPYNINPPTWNPDDTFEDEKAAFSPLTGDREESANHSYLGFGQSLMGEGC